MTIYCRKDVILSKRPQKSHEGGGVLKRKVLKVLGGGGGLLAILFGDKFLKFGQNLTY